VLGHELAIRSLGLREAAAREEFRGGVAREAVIVRHLHFGRAPLLRERLRELARLLVVHDLACGKTRSLRELEEVDPLDVVRVYAQGMKLA